jgi:hypothetical protein
MSDETNTKKVWVFTTDNSDVADFIRGTAYYSPAQRATEVADDDRLQLITAIHMQQDRIAESIVELSNAENDLLEKGYRMTVSTSLQEVQTNLKWCVEHANRLDVVRRLLGDLWEIDPEFAQRDLNYEEEVAIEGGYTHDGQGGPDYVPEVRELDYCQTHDGKCAPDERARIAREVMRAPEELREGP